LRRSTLSLGRICYRRWTGANRSISCGRGICIGCGKVSRRRVRALVLRTG
jgi:hypothetical protein